MLIKSWLLCTILIFTVVNGVAAEPPRGDQRLTSGPDFTLPDVEGKVISLREFKGEVVVLNFWAFWCDTWKDELPHLKELAKEQSERDFKLVAVSVDGTRLQEFMDRTKGEVGFPVLLDAGGEVSASYKVAHVPTLIILDGSGRIRYATSGYPGNEAVRTVLRKLASEKSKEPITRASGIKLLTTRPAFTGRHGSRLLGIKQFLPTFHFQNSNRQLLECFG